jgi:hypothetical protein
LAPGPAAAREASGPVVETLLVGKLLHDLFALVEGQHAPPEDIAALQPDGREQDARVQRRYLVILPEMELFGDKCYDF